MKTQLRVKQYGAFVGSSLLGYSVALVFAACAVPLTHVSETIPGSESTSSATSARRAQQDAQKAVVEAAHLRSLLTSHQNVSQQGAEAGAGLLEEPKPHLIYARFEYGDLPNADLAAVVQAINLKTASQFKVEEFRLSDEVDLLNEHYFRFEQVALGENGTPAVPAVPVESSSIRIWVAKKKSQGEGLGGEAVESPLLVEAFLTPVHAAGTAGPVLRSSDRGLSRIVRSFEQSGDETPERDFGDVVAAVRKEMSYEFAARSVLRLKKSNIAFADQKKQKLRLLRRIEVKLREGSVVFDFENKSPVLVRKFFKDSAAADDFVHKKHSPASQRSGGGALSLAANVYPLWELTNADVSAGAADALALPTAASLPRILERVPAPHLRSVLGSRSLSFLESKKKEGPLSPADIFAGYWNQDFLNLLFPKPWEKQPVQLRNELGYGLPVRLFGKNVIVMLHQDVLKNFPSTSKLRFSNAPQYAANYEEIPGANGNPESKVTYVPLKWGKAVFRADDLLERSPYGNDGKAHPDDTASLIDSGFDEAQVYFSTDTFMDTLQNLGFADPELSTRPFTAILFDPALEARDNAYYDSDTINFTTYSATEMNMARDSSTIWHELGHGIQDRLMGPHIDSSEGYGLWEGMADFIAQIVISQKFGIEPFSKRETLRILNTTQFYLTNESHDEGEAYGGAMNSMLEMMIGKYGLQEGILRMTDLTLETMRLTRDHPKLTAEVWFEQMKYVDSLPRETLVPARVPGELHEIIARALSSRNYNPGQTPAAFEVFYRGQAVSDRSAGSRSSPITVDPALGAVQSYELELMLKDGAATRFRYPVTVKAVFRGGPLQGAMKWLGEENGPKSVVVTAPGEKVSLPVQVDTSTCDFANRSDGGCRDFVYLQVFNAGDETTGKPAGKKRFYLQKKGSALSPALARK